MPDIGEMPAGGAEPGESAWAAAEKLAEAHEAELVSKGLPVPGGDAGSVQETPASEAKPEQAKQAPKGKDKPAEPVASDKSAELKQLEAMAAKLGYKFDGNRVEVAERVALRNERRQLREQMGRELAQHQAKIAEETTKFQGSAERYRAFEAAREANDFEGMAKAAGFDSWKALVNEHTKRLASPEYREIQELKRRDAEREEAIRKDREAQAQAQQAQQQATSIAQYKAGMADEMKAGGGQLEAMAADPHMVNMLYDVRAEHYRQTGEELDLQEVLETPSRVFGGKSILDVLEESYQNLSKIFGDRPAQAEASQEVAPRGGSSSRSREQKKPPKTVSQRNAAEASAPPTFPDTPEGEKAFKAYFAQQLNQATSIS